MGKMVFPAGSLLMVQSIYNVTGSKEWVNGEHVPSNGQAKCGRDESSSIGQSPHGTSVLAKLPVIGTLQ